MNESREEWRPAPELPDHYEVSSQGRVRRRPGFYNPGQYRLLRPVRETYLGHLAVNLSVNNVRYRRKVHRLVAAAFIGPCPDGYLVRHLNGDPSDNRLVNIAYGTPQDNSDDAKRHGTISHHGYPVRSHCKNGHEFTPENTFKRHDSGRGCRACRAVIAARYRAKRSG
ncbi:NUMOD4 motif-containing HNH endonuclease [Curtobacterium sp. MCBD17_030]|uniref:NUMOD4 motif-containing HNH endonuclease n=1 Tax=Curtobacterium sp. MCBD17_030 TaxID=2175649 RepID=UPI000DA09283|nr:hypothetical protein DEI89_12995 [Curtobacterium sp. MCBD17_030]